MAVSIVELETAPTIDGAVTPNEYGLGGVGALAEPDGDDSFGSGNNLGNLYVAWKGTKLYFGLQNATLEANNGIVFFIHSPNLTNGTTEPSDSADQGESGDSGTPNHAESLVTRANVAIGNAWTFPNDIHFGFGLVDDGVSNGDEVRAFGDPGTRDNVGLYSFDTTNIDNLGFESSEINFDDNAGASGGLEFTVDLADLGIAVGDTIIAQGFITSNSGFTSNESLPGASLNGTQAGTAAKTFGSGLDLTLEEAQIAIPEPGTLSLLVLGGLLLRRFRKKLHA